jgi:hypothetical protein
LLDLFALMIHFLKEGEQGRGRRKSGEEDGVTFREFTSNWPFPPFLFCSLFSPLSRCVWGGFS